MLTPSIGTELPEIAFYEPCFGQELEWIMLDALEHLRSRRRSAYLRLTTRPVDQSLFRLPDDPDARERLRFEVLQGAYRLRDARGRSGYAPGTNVVHIFTCGSMVPEALAAMEALHNDGIHVNLFNVTGPGPLYRRFHDAMRCAVDGEGEGLGVLGDLVPADERHVPVVTVVDGHPHALSWIGGALGTRVWPLGVVAFGQSGSMPDIHRSHHIDSESIAATCRRALAS